MIPCYTVCLGYCGFIEPAIWARIPGFTVRLVSNSKGVPYMGFGSVWVNDQPRIEIPGVMFIHA